MKTILFVLPFFLLISCREPIELNFGTTNSKLVIDGFITNVEKEHSIHLTRSSGFTEGGIHVIDSVSGALVEIIDDSGISIVLEQQGVGEYRTPIFRAEPGKNYKLMVQFEGETYESSFQALPEHIEETKIRFEPEIRQTLNSTETTITEQHGIGIFLNLDPVDEKVYYHFLQRNFFIWEAPNADGIELQCEFCYVRGFDRPQVDLFENSNAGLAGAVELELDFIPVSPLMQHEFSVQVIQLITNQESHNYWSAIKSQLENVGSQFDAVPSSINGNIANSKGEQALGFFGVYNETSQRLFFDNDDSGIPLEQVEVFEPCPVPYTPGDPDPCFDCRFAQGLWSQLEIPDWWRSHTIKDDDGGGIRSNFLYTRWSLGTTILSRCIEEHLNGETRQVCNSNNCEEYVFTPSDNPNDPPTVGKYTKTNIIDARTTTIKGKFRILDKEISFLPNGTNDIETFTMKVEEETLTLSKEVSECIETRIYNDG